MRPNRLVAGPAGALASIVAGLLATWLAQHVPFLHVSHGQVEQAVVFLAGVLVHEAGRQQWLKGWREFAQTEADKLLYTPGSVPPSVELNPAGPVDPVAPPVPDDGLTEQLTKLQADVEQKDAALKVLDERLADREARLAQFRTLVLPDAAAPLAEAAPEPPAQP